MASFKTISVKADDIAEVKELSELLEAKLGVRISHRQAVMKAVKKLKQELSSEQFNKEIEGN